VSMANVQITMQNMNITEVNIPNKSTQWFIVSFPTCPAALHRAGYKGRTLYIPHHFPEPR